MSRGRYPGSMAPLEPFYVLLGSDRPKVLRVARRLRARVVDDGGTVDELDATAVGPAEVAARCMALGLFGGGRLVVVHGFETWGGRDGLMEIDERLAPYLADPTPDTVLALVAGPGTVRKDHRILRLVERPEQLLAYELPTGRDLPAYLRRRANDLGARLEPEALRRLIEIVGERPAALEQELDKLATHAAGEPIDAELVEQLAFPAAGVAPFAVLDALSGRRRPALYRSLERAFDAGDKPHALLPQVARQLDLLHRAGLAAAEGDDYRSFSRRARVHEFRARKAFESASSWPPAEAATAICRLAAADHAMKGGARIDPELALELALAASV